LALGGDESKLKKIENAVGSKKRYAQSTLKSLARIPRYIGQDIFYGFGDVLCLPCGLLSTGMSYKVRDLGIQM
jgi:hypothetical protein